MDEAEDTKRKECKTSETMIAVPRRAAAIWLVREGVGSRRLPAVHAARPAHLGPLNAGWTEKEVNDGSKRFVNDGNPTGRVTPSRKRVGG